ncbi:MAG: hypothetical protein QXQ82_02130 [Candidatus Pacearchaeota archaeon]
MEKGYVLHYTCNPPTKDVLDHYKIKQIGKEYGFSERELLLIPEELIIKEKGYMPEDKIALAIICENLLAQLSLLKNK